MASPTDTIGVLAEGERDVMPAIYIHPAKGANAQTDIAANAGVRCAHRLLLVVQREDVAHRHHADALPHGRGDVANHGELCVCVS